VAVVVSEETGIISLVQEGRIRRELDGQKLREALLESLEGKARAPSEAPAPEAVTASEE
jgi:DNA-binding TFAR19-related protein (PDSD5 family)